MAKPTPTIQNFPWAASVEAIKSSVRYSSYQDFYGQLVEQLPHNSIETRRKYASLIQRRFFPEKSLDGLLPLVWRCYQDETILGDLMRVYGLESEPIIARFVMQELNAASPGTGLELSQVRTFITELFGEVQIDSYNRLLNACRDMGFLNRYGSEWHVEAIPAPVNAFMILLHERLAPEPRIVRLSEIVDATWWRYLGIREASVLRESLQRAASAELISRFTKVDELEQVTTRYTRSEYIGKARRL